LYLESATEEKAEHKPAVLDQERIPVDTITPVSQNEVQENLVTNGTGPNWEEKPADILRDQLEDCLSIDYNVSLAEIAQQIVDQVTKERKDFNRHSQAIEKANEDLRSGSSY
jgi:hypothetical protein